MQRTIHPDVFREKADQGMAILLHYNTGEHRAVAAGDYRIAGDILIIKIEGQRPATNALWLIEEVESFDTIELAKEAMKALRRLARRSAK